MKKKYFIMIYCIIISYMMFIAGNLIHIYIKENKNKINNTNININENKIKEKYTLVNMNIGNNSIKRPVFDNIILDKEIENFITLNSCNELYFNVEYLTNDMVNIMLECNNYKKNIIYDLKKSIQIDFKELINDKVKFVESVYNLLNLKYPKFVTDEVDIINGQYVIKNNYIELTSNTSNFGIVTLIINNNEIKDLLNYEMKYDNNYKNEVYELDPKKKTIAFTFDDGPSEYDLEIIKALKESHASATFFIVGSRINNYQRSIHSMVENNMEVGNHSYNHKYLSKIDNNSILNEINNTNNTYKNITGKDLTLIRPPYGAYKSNIHSLSNRPIILWSVDTLDWKVRNRDKVYHNIIDNVKDGDIILMHSLFETTKDAVIKVLPELYKRGYQITSVTELANLKGINMSSGNVYRNF